MIVLCRLDCYTTWRNRESNVMLVDVIDRIRVIAYADLCLSCRSCIFDFEGEFGKDSGIHIVFLRCFRKPSQQLTGFGRIECEVSRRYPNPF